MCVNAEDGNQFPVSIIQKAMNQLNVKINANKQAKPQATQIINQLKEVLPIERARMHLKVTFDNLGQAEALQKLLAEKHENQFTVVEEKKDEEGESVQLVLAVEPSLFKAVSDITKADQTFYKDVIVEIQDAKPVQQADVKPAKQIIEEQKEKKKSKPDKQPIAEAEESKEEKTSSKASEQSEE